MLEARFSVNELIYIYIRLLLWPSGALPHTEMDKCLTKLSVTGTICRHVIETNEVFMHILVKGQRQVLVYKNT